MMAGILNSAMLNSDTAILDSDTLLSSLRFTQKHSHSNLTLNQTNSIWLKLNHSHLTWWWQPSWILPSWIQLFCTKKNFTYLFWLNLMMAAILNFTILNSAIVDSTILHKTLTQTNSIWCKLIHSHSTWWWQPSWILPSWIQPFCAKLWLKLIQSESNSFILSQLDEGSHLELCHLGFTHFVQNSDSN